MHNYSKNALGGGECVSAWWCGGGQKLMTPQQPAASSLQLSARRGSVEAWSAPFGPSSSLLSTLIACTHSTTINCIMFLRNM